MHPYQRTLFISMPLVIVLLSLTPDISLSKSAKDIEFNVSFCPGNCDEGFFDYFKKHQTYCAFFDLDGSIYEQIKHDNLSILLDEDTRPLDRNIKSVKSWGLMHNKFCIDGDRILTGSANPTENDLYKNFNNIITLTDRKLANAYKEQYTFIGNKTRARQRVSSHNVDLCFSPEGQCIDVVIDEISKAENSILIAAFSLTHPRITQHLLIQHSRGVNVTVLVEESQCHAGCIAPTLKANGITVFYENSSAKVHHKVLVIDQHTVITGSMNPTKNGNDNNFENTLVIRDTQLARKFTEEILRIIVSSSSR